MPLALYNFKNNIYKFSQGNLTCHKYYEQFKSLVDVFGSYDGHLYWKGMMNVTCEELHSNVLKATFGNLTLDKKQMVTNHTNEMCKGIIFIA